MVLEICSERCSFCVGWLGNPVGAGSLPVPFGGIVLRSFYEARIIVCDSYWTLTAITQLNPALSCVLADGLVLVFGALDTEQK